MSEAERLGDLIVRALEVLAFVVIALMHRRTRKAVEDTITQRVSAVGMEVKRAIASSLRPAALTCGGCAHSQDAHAPELQRESAGLQVGERIGPCTAKFCCCPGWTAPAELELEREDLDATPTTLQGDG